APRRAAGVAEARQAGHDHPEELLEGEAQVLVDQRQRGAGAQPLQLRARRLHPGAVALEEVGERLPDLPRLLDQVLRTLPALLAAAGHPPGTRGEAAQRRSEERRVGKECRSPW